MNASHKIIVPLGLGFIASIYLMSYCSSLWMLMADFLAGISISFVWHATMQKIRAWLLYSFVVPALHLIILLCIHQPASPSLVKNLVETAIESFPFGLPFGFLACGLGILMANSYQRRGITG